jgi:metal-sulfur cluster biosynthetic enzyme
MVTKGMIEAEIQAKIAMTGSDWKCSAKTAVQDQIKSIMDWASGGRW